MNAVYALRRRFLAAVLAALSWTSVSPNVLADDEVFQTLRCDYSDEVAPLAVEADMTDFDEFTPSGRFLSDGNSIEYPLSQKKPHKGELFRFVLNEQNPAASATVLIYSNESGLPSRIIFNGAKPPHNYEVGACYFR